MEKLGKKILETRKKKGMSANTLAEKIGKSGSSGQQFIYDLEKGRIARVNLRVMREIADALELSLLELMEYETGTDKYSTDKKQSEIMDKKWSDKYNKLALEIKVNQGKLIETQQELIAAKNTEIELRKELFQLKSGQK